MGGVPFPGPISHKSSPLSPPNISASSGKPPFIHLRSLSLSPPRPLLFAFFGVFPFLYNNLTFLIQVNAFSFFFPSLPSPPSSLLSFTDGVLELCPKSSLCFRDCDHTFSHKPLIGQTLNCG